MVPAEDGVRRAPDELEKLTWMELKRAGATVAAQSGRVSDLMQMKWGGSTRCDLAVKARWLVLLRLRTPQSDGVGTSWSGTTCSTTTVGLLQRLRSLGQVRGKCQDSSILLTVYRRAEDSISSVQALDLVFLSVERPLADALPAAGYVVFPPGLGLLQGLDASSPAGGRRRIRPGIKSGARE